jgi:hypothetical protein
MFDMSRLMGEAMWCSDVDKWEVEGEVEGEAEGYLYPVTSVMGTILVP